MQTITMSGLTDSRATITGYVMAIYSPQPVVVDLTANYKSRVDVINTRTGRTYSETRSPFAYTSGTATRYKCEYDISRMMQLAGDVEGALERLTYNGQPQPMGETYAVKIYYYKANAWVQGGLATVTGIYGACDWGETINAANEARRLFVHYPQTIRCSYDPNEEGVVIGADSDIVVDYEGENGATLELDIMAALGNEVDAHYDDHLAGLNPADSVSFCYEIANGQGSSGENNKTYAFKDDTTANNGRGFYLRWLHRDGTAGYWLFTRSKEAFSATAGSSYTARLDGVPAAPQNGTVRNAARQDFNIASTLTLGCANVTAEEFNYLCGLASSPVVQLLIGGTRTAPIWARVNVVAGSYTREYPRSGLGRLAPFELAITLPARNAIKL